MMEYMYSIKRGTEEGGEKPYSVCGGKVSAVPYLYSNAAGLDCDGFVEGDSMATALESLAAAAREGDVVILSSMKDGRDDFESNGYRRLVYRGCHGERMEATLHAHLEWLRGVCFDDPERDTAVGLALSGAAGKPRGKAGLRR